jgi:hypothetical protein
VVLGGGADHRRAADVDVLDAVFVGRALLDGRLERVQVHYQEIDRLDAVLGHRLPVLGIAADRQQAAMHLGMQGLDAAVHHLGEAGKVRHVRDLQPRFGDRLGGTAGGDQFDTMRRKRARKFDQPGLVGNGQQSPGDRARKIGHGQNPLS